MSDPRPKVSVLMLAYNHGRYIRQSVESVLRQETRFPVEIVIGEDCSKDDTRSVLQDLAQQHPDRIRLHLPERNQGAAANLAATFARCRGDYLAVLEGDDYWLGTTKLQAQVDLLESRPDCALCFHDVLVIDDATEKVIQHHCDPKPAAFSTTEDLLARNFVPTCSAVYRRSAMPAALPPEFLTLAMQDWPTWIRVSLSGRIAYLDEVWGCYRVHVGGTWRAVSEHRRMLSAIQMMLDVLPVLSPATAAVARQQIQLHRMRAAAASLAEGRRWAALRQLVHCAGAREYRSGATWLALEALTSRRFTNAAKRRYRAIRGLPAI